MYTLFCFALLFSSLLAYPVPVPPGGRNSVHGWLILPVDQPEPSPTTPVGAWFVHHTPEFWTDSPHNFQIILYGTMVPFETANNLTEPIPLPYPPSSPLLGYEFTITPPGPFSLNDLLTSRITTLYGVVYNGSFDTPYERYALAMATLRIENLTTAVYLNYSSSVVPLPNLQYYQYPRSLNGTSEDSVAHLYLSHQIQAAPDFDQVIHAVVMPSSCNVNGYACSAADLLSEAGNIWVFPYITNDVAHRLMPGGAVEGTMQTQLGCSMTCKLVVLEEIHCVVGPAFADVCA